MGAIQKGDLPDESESFDVPEAEAPDRKVLAQLADAGLSNAGLDVIGGAGTARRVHRQRTRASKLALDRARRARTARLVAAATVGALVLAILFGRSFDLSIAVSAVIGLAVFLLVVGLRGVKQKHHS